MISFMPTEGGANFRIFIAFMGGPASLARLVASPCAKSGLREEAQVFAPSVKNDRPIFGLSSPNVFPPKFVDGSAFSMAEIGDQDSGSPTESFGDDKKRRQNHAGMTLFRCDVTNRRKQE